MNFKQLPKEKRNHLVLVILVTAIALGGIGFGLIRFQYDHIRLIEADTADAQKKLSQMQESIRKSDQLELALAEATRILATQEEGMAAPVDQYAWVLDTIRRFTLPYKVEIPVVNQPVVGETMLLPKFPYKQASISLSGTGYYHDIGRFIADFENHYPHIRLVNLALDPVSSLISDEKEKLEFKMEVIVLVRPNPS